MITASEAQALGAFYYAARTQSKAPQPEWEDAVSLFFAAYITAAQTSHPSGAHVVGVVTPEEHAEIAARFEGAYYATGIERIPALDAVARQLHGAVYSDLPSPGDTPAGLPAGVNLTTHFIEEWRRKGVEPGLTQEGDVCFHYDGDASLMGLNLQAHHPNSKAALMHWSGRGPSDASFSSCRISGQNWGVRSYRVRSESYVHCEFVGIPREHGYYSNMMGGGTGLIFHRCLFEDIAAQAIQTVSAAGRPNETPDPSGDNVLGGPIVVDACELVNVGNDSENAVGGGTSYPLSFFTGKHRVTVSDTSLDNSMQPDSHGFMHCEGHDLDGFERELEWTGGTVRINNPNRPVGKFRRMGSVYIAGVDFQVQGGQNKLEFYDDCKQIKIESCTGDTRITVNGLDVGSVADGYSQ